MKYQHCITKHNPPETYGDCLRACIASMLDMECVDVPNFVDGGVDAGTAFHNLREWLVPLRLTPFIVAFAGEIATDDLLNMMGILNPTSTYILFGSTRREGEGDHCVVCVGGEIVHNPAWHQNNIIGPLSNGTWQTLVLGQI